MTKDGIREFVKNYIDSYEEDVFIRNQYGQLIYSSGASSLNLEVFFEDIIETFLENEIKIDVK